LIQGDNPIILDLEKKHVRANGYCCYDGTSISATGSEYPLNIFAVQFYKIEGDERLPRVPRF